MQLSPYVWVCCEFQVHTKPQRSAGHGGSSVQSEEHKEIPAAVVQADQTQQSLATKASRYLWFKGRITKLCCCFRVCPLSHVAHRLREQLQEANARLEAELAEMELAPVQRKIEARSSDDSFTGLVRTLYFADTFLSDSEFACQAWSTACEQHLLRNVTSRTFVFSFSCRFT